MRAPPASPTASFAALRARPPWSGAQAPPTATACDRGLRGRGVVERRLTPAVIINKIDRPDARSQEVLNEVYDLFIDLDATEDQLDFPVIYCNARAGTSTLDLATPGTDLRPLLDAIIEHIPPPHGL